MKRLDNITSTQKISFIVTAILVVGLTLYGTTAYMLNMWPFAQKTSQTQLKPPAANPKMTMVKPTVDTKTDVLHTDTVIETKEQGDCKLTLTSGDNVYTLTNSTKGLKDRTGCLDWNIGTGNIVPGEYDVEVKFIGKTQTATTKQTVTIP